MADESFSRESVLAGIFSVVFLFVVWYRKRDPLLDAIPTVGFSDPILSYFSALRYNLDSKRVIDEGCAKYKPGVFKVATFRRWTVLVTSHEHVEDMRGAPDDVLSFVIPASEVIQIDHTINLLVKDDEYHAHVVRTKLTRNIQNTFGDVYDEIVTSLDELMPVSGDNWVKVPIMEIVQKAICRITNRVFVGLPLCRDPEYQKLNLEFATRVMTIATILIFFPEPLKPFVTRMLSNLPAQFRKEVEFLRPMVEERFARLDELGDEWEDRPNDFLMWLMSEAQGPERSLEGLARRMMLVNFASIHSTSLTTMKALYRLIAHPEYVEGLRQDVEAAVAEEGWTKAGMDKMLKVDSFLRESQRLQGMGLLSLSRVTLKPFTFSNGLTIPAGVNVAVAVQATHEDQETYAKPKDFDGFRFAKLREVDHDATMGKYQTVSTSPEHLPFGHGRHACPGRFFAVNEIKTLLATIVTRYDLKFEDGKGMPPEICFASALIPRSVDVMVRKRQK
ncbi:cytochrome P450 [Gloeopeniophorella convolvens]|nr:cytochrome P450 [Gloeopeniophorella convolvens]